MRVTIRLDAKLAQQLERDAKRDVRLLHEQIVYTLRRALAEQQPAAGAGGEQ